MHETSAWCWCHSSYIWMGQILRDLVVVIPQSGLVRFFSLFCWTPNWTRSPVQVISWTLNLTFLNQFHRSGSGFRGFWTWTGPKKIKIFQKYLKLFRTYLPPSQWLCGNIQSVVSLQKWCYGSGREASALNLVIIFLPEGISGIQFLLLLPPPGSLAPSYVLCSTDQDLT